MTQTPINKNPVLHASAPSKTFLIGEYAVLNGGCALLMASKPRFSLTLQHSITSTSHLPDHQTLWQRLCQHYPTLNSYQPSFHDPHQGRGGFGASSALILLTQYLHAQLIVPHATPPSLFDYRTGIDTLRALTWDGDGIPPSGGDLVAQTLGRITAYDAKQRFGASYGWPFSPLGMMVVRTGYKLATHQHLSHIDQGLFEELVDLSQESLDAFQKGHMPNWIASINRYRNALERLNLATPHTQELCHQFQNFPGVLATKGCGAMGADAILIVYTKEAHQRLYQALTSQWPEPIVASDDDLCSGLSVNKKHKNKHPNHHPDQSRLTDA